MEAAKPPRYLWPGDECATHDRPCDGYYWESLPEEPSLYVAVRRLRADEEPQILPVVETFSLLLAWEKQRAATQSYPQDELFGKRTALYRCFNIDGDLIYVGVAVDPERRWKYHAFRTPWWREVKERQVEWHENRQKALNAELAVIQTESPKYNVMGK